MGGIKISESGFTLMQLLLSTAIPALIDKVAEKVSGLTEEEIEAKIEARKANTTALMADIREIMKGD